MLVGKCVPLLSLISIIEGSTSPRNHKSSNHNEEHKPRGISVSDNTKNSSKENKSRHSDKGPNSTVRKLRRHSLRDSSFKKNKNNIKKIKRCRRGNSLKFSNPVKKKLPSNYQTFKIDCKLKTVWDFVQADKIIPRFVYDYLFISLDEPLKKNIGKMILILLPYLQDNYAQDLKSFYLKNKDNEQVKELYSQRYFTRTLTPISTLNISKVEKPISKMMAESLLDIEPEVLDRTFQLWYRNLLSKVSHGDLIEFLCGLSTKNPLEVLLRKYTMITDWFGALMALGSTKSEIRKRELLHAIYILGNQANGSKNLSLLQNIYTVLSNNEIQKKYSLAAAFLFEHDVWKIVEEWGKLTTYLVRYGPSRKICEANDQILPLFPYLNDLALKIREIPTFNHKQKLNISKMIHVHNFLLFFYKWSSEYYSRIFDNPITYPNDDNDLQNLNGYMGIIEELDSVYQIQWDTLI